MVVLNCDDVHMVVIFIELVGAIDGQVLTKLAIELFYVVILIKKNS